jgi:hypothetical protein
MPEKAVKKFNKYHMLILCEGGEIIEDIGEIIILC